MTAALAGGIIIFMLIFTVVMLIIGILMIVAEWKLFKKAGEHGWAAIIPFYNSYVLTKITWGNGWLFLLGFLPLGNIIFLIQSIWKGNRICGRIDFCTVHLSAHAGLWKRCRISGTGPEQ